MKKFLKILTIFAFFVTLQTSYSFASKPTIKEIDEIKTFDFEKILIETEKYFKAADDWKVIKCSPKTGFVCTKRECPRITENDTSHTIIDKKRDVISICRNGGCKHFKADIRQAGVFHTVKVKDSDGIIIRILGDNRYKEITMLGLDAYISNGECEEYDAEKEKMKMETEMKAQEKSTKKKYRLKKGK